MKTALAADLLSGRWPYGQLTRPITRIRCVCRTSGVINYFFDSSHASWGDGQDIVKLDPRRLRRLKAIGADDARIYVEETVGAQAPALMMLDLV